MPPVIERVRVATGTPQSMHRLPLGASLLDAAQLRSMPSVTGDAALRALPGFDRNRSNSAFTNYGQLRVSFAGAGNDRGVILVDGIPAQDAFGGQVDWAAYPAIDLTRAELLRGPGSALYGSGAIGGVLELDTFAPHQAQTPAGFLQAAAGTHDALDLATLATAPLSSKLTASIAATQQQSSYFDLPPGYQSPIDTPALSRAKLVSLKFRYAASSSTSIEYGYRGAWDYQQEGRPNYDFWRDFGQHHLTIDRSSANASLSANIYVRNTFVTNRADRSAAPGTLLYTQYVPTHESGAILQWTVDRRSGTFAARADARSVGGVSDQLSASNATSAYGSGTQHVEDLALQNTWRFRRGEAVAGIAGSAISLPRATVFSGGIATSIVPHTDRALSPRAALRYDLTPQLAFRASAGTGFRAPFLNELVHGYVIGPVSYLPNPYLVPERSSSIDAGLDWARGSEELSADLVRTFVSDAIGFTTVDATHQIRSNIAHTQTDGLIATYTHRLSACSSVTLSATEQNARVTAGEPATIGKKLPYVPEAAASASFDTRAGATQFGFTVAYLGQTFADDLNREPLGTSVVAGVRASAPLRDGARVLFSADNLTNARYLSSIDRYGPPARVSVGLILPFGTRATSCRHVSFPRHGG